MFFYFFLLKILLTIKVETIAVAIRTSQNKTEHSSSAASHVRTDLCTMLDPEHLDELMLIRSHHKTKSESN